MTEITQELPTPSTGTLTFGSDAIAGFMRQIDVPYFTVVPGASFRGLHDSLVNHLGNQAPQMLLVIHEETAASVAHGFAKASGKMMGAILHSNVGLLHASMSIFNAWCDRVPMIVIGATGPLDAARRRPWIDWIHTMPDQASLIRDFLKWDDQPGSVAAAGEAIVRAAQIARTAPCGPTLVSIDISLQEAPINELPPPIDLARFAPASAAPSTIVVEAAARVLSSAKHPLVMVGRVDRSEAGWAERLALIEALDADVLCDLKAATGFPTDHPLLAAVPGYLLDEEGCAALRRADVILSLDWVDLGGALSKALETIADAPTIVHVSPDQAIHRGAMKDYFTLPPVDHGLYCAPEAAVPLLRGAIRPRPPIDRDRPRPTIDAAELAPGESMHIEHIAAALNAAAGDMPLCLARLPLGWHGAFRHFRHPLDYLGYDGGAGIGSGPGMAIGAALALKDDVRTTVAILGDGDFMMDNSAVWTATHYGIPLLMIIANNRSFYNDEAHQERVALHRGRPVENKWIGLALSSPDIDLAAIARAQGAHGIGPVDRLEDLKTAIAEGLRRVSAGEVVVIDARIAPGYATDLSGGLQAGMKKHD